MESLYRKLSASYVVLFLVSGLALTFLIPPFQVPDENMHWTAAVARSADLLRGEQRECSAAMALPDVFEVHRIKFRPDQKARSEAFTSALDSRVCTGDPVTYGNVLSYPAVPVLAPFFWALPGELSGRQALAWFYLSRILHGLVVVVALMRFRRAAINAGGGGWLFVAAFAVCPLFVQQCFAVSSDVTTNALSILLLAALLFSGQLAGLDWVLMAGLGISAAASKPTILPLAIAVLAVVAGWGTKGVRKRALLCAAILSVTGLVMFLRFRLTPAPSEAGVDPVLQAQFFLTHPWQSLRVLLLGVWDHVRFLHLYGRLGWLDTDLPTNARSLWLGSIWFALMLDALPFVFRRQLGLQTGGSTAKTFLGAATVFIGTLVSALGITYALYLVFTPVGATKVAGLQGRYFFPHFLVWVGVIFWAARALHPGKQQTLSWRLPQLAQIGIVGLVTCGSVFSLGRVLFAVYERYW